MAHQLNRIGQRLTKASKQRRFSRIQTGADESLPESKARYLKHGVAIGGVFVIAGAVALTWIWSMRGLDRPQASTGVSAAGRTLTITPVATTARLTLSCTVGPGKTVAIHAPFDGMIRERRVELGTLVKTGDILFVLDGAEIESRLREVEAAVLKSFMTVETLSRWSESPDVIRARRALEAADASLATIERQLVETKKLLDRGIVSRNEYDGLVQQRDTQQVIAGGSKLDLQTTVERGNADNRRLADLELQNAKSRLADLQTQADGRIVRALVDGIVIRPPIIATSSTAPSAVEVGSRVTRGQVIYSIADTATLIVTGKVDEVDVNRLRVGQVVSIDSDAFPGNPISGHIVGISAEAEAGQNLGRVPYFEVRAAFSNANDTLRNQIRIGMSARMQILISDNPNAIIVPIDVVQNLTTDPSILVRDTESGQPLLRRVTLGTTQDNGIEIVQGLRVGDIVIYP